MKQTEAIKEALKFLQTGKALDVVAAIEVLKDALVQPTPCDKCHFPEHCKFYDQCMRSKI